MPVILVGDGYRICLANNGSEECQSHTIEDSVFCCGCEGFWERIEDNGILTHIDEENPV